MTFTIEVYRQPRLGIDEFLGGRWNWFVYAAGRTYSVDSGISFTQRGARKQAEKAARKYRIEIKVSHLSRLGDQVAVYQYEDGTS